MNRLLLGLQQPTLQSPLPDSWLEEMKCCGRMDKRDPPHLIVWCRLFCFLIPLHLTQLLCEIT